MAGPSLYDHGGPLPHNGVAINLHQPDEYHATHYPDGVLHTFTGPNNDGRVHTWHATTRHPEGTNREQL